MKTVICKVNDSWMAGLENAYLSVTSPSGGNRTLDKLKYWDTVRTDPTEDLSIVNEIRDLVTQSINADGKVRISYSIELTTDQMKRFSTIVEKTNNPHLNFDVDPAGGRGLHSHI
jgi:hypothetical protein